MHCSRMRTARLLPYPVVSVWGGGGGGESALPVAVGSALSVGRDSALPVAGGGGGGGGGSAIPVGVCLTYGGFALPVGVCLTCVGRVCLDADTPRIQTPQEANPRSCNH